MPPRVHHPHRRAQSRLRAAVEAMERRVLLSTVTVNTVADRVDPPGSATVSLRDAISIADNSQDSVAITFDPHVFAAAQPIVLKNSGLTLSHNTFGNITLTGPSAGLIIAGDANDPVFSIAKGVHFNLIGVTVVNGGDGGIINAGTVRISHCTISHNTGPIVGGIENSGTMTIAASTVAKNRNYSDAFDADGAGGIKNTGTLTISGSAISANASVTQTGGGGINNLGELTLRDSTITGNQDVPVVFSPGVTITYPVTNYDIGGGVDNTGSASVSGCTISGNLAQLPQTAYPYVYGSAINNLGTMTVAATAATNKYGYSSNYGPRHFAVNNSGRLTITSSTINASTSASIISSGVLTLSLTRIDGTAAASQLSSGLGLELFGRAFVSGCTIEDFAGAGVESYGRATLQGCTISGNSDGGIAQRAGLLVLTDCTISGNTSNNAQSGGVFSSGYGYLQINDCTISQNKAGIGAGIYLTKGSGTVTISNSIVAGNIAKGGGRDADVHGAFRSLSHNLIGQTDGSSGWSRADLTGTSAHPLDPLLSPLGNFSGPTQTQVPMAGSPALGAGSVALLRPGTTTDQRGLPRVSGGVMDIGAVQVQRPAKITVNGPGSYTTVGATPLSIALGNFSDPGGVGPFVAEVHWGDGSPDTVFSLAKAGSLGTQAHVFEKLGRIQGSISLTDSSGALSNLATFNVTVSPAPPIAIVVNTTGDSVAPAGSGAINLRRAVGLADRAGGPVTISFDPAVFATPQTITLNGNQLELSNDFFGPISISGPAAGLTISGNRQSSIFVVDRGISASFSGLTLINGFASTVDQFEGGAISNFGSLALSNCNLANNFAGAGGAIENRGDLSISHSTISSNSTNEGNGGGIDSSGPLTLIDSTISDNSCLYGNGGGIFSSSAATITACTLSGNHAYAYDHTAPYTVGADYPGGSGGAIANTSQLTLTNSTITGNSADTAGGDVYNTGVARIISSTLYGDSGGQTYAPHATLSAPHATLILANSILDAPTGIGGTIQSLGHNLITARYSDSISGLTASDLTGNAAGALNANLLPLNDYGGPTQTMPPGSGSPAIGAGSAALIPAGLSTDQRGFARIVNGIVDIGAVELTRAGTISITPPPKQNVVAGVMESVQLGSFVDAGGSGPFHVVVNWNDGSAQSTFTLSSAGKIGPVAHKFTDVGNLTGTLYITDADGDISRFTNFSIAAAVHPLVSIVVNTTKATGDGNSTVSFADAIEMANSGFGPFDISFDPKVITKPQSVAGFSLTDNHFGLIRIIAPAAGAIVNGGCNVSGGVGAEISGFNFVGTVTNYGGLRLSHCSISHGVTRASASRAGGAGIYNSGDMTVIDTTISSNQAFGGEGYKGSIIFSEGGGVLNSGTMRMVGCTITHNTADMGAGISNEGTLSITNCTICDNTDALDGGGIATAGALNIVDSTITGNSASSGGGLYVADNPEPTIANTIIAQNISTNGLDGVGGPDVSGGIVSKGHNLIGQTDDSSGWIASDLTGTAAKPLDPKLSPLANHGGPTQTQIPLAGSPAIGAGSVALIPKGITTDQRGKPRDVNGKVDIGAVEVQSNESH